VNPQDPRPCKTPNCRRPRAPGVAYCHACRDAVLKRIRPFLGPWITDRRYRPGEAREAQAETRGELDDR
jgi:hypothetical protein